MSKSGPESALPYSRILAKSLELQEYDTLHEILELNANNHGVTLELNKLQTIYQRQQQNINLIFQDDKIPLEYKLVTILKSKYLNVHQKLQYVHQLMSMKFNDKELDIHTRNDVVLRWACYNGMHEGMQNLVSSLLFNGADVHTHNNLPLRDAVAKNNFNLVILLLSHVIKQEGIDARNKMLAVLDFAPLRMAAENGSSKLLVFILGFSCQADSRNNYAIKKASKNGHNNVVKLLLKMQPIPIITTAVNICDIKALHIIIDEAAHEKRRGQRFQRLSFVMSNV